MMNETGNGTRAFAANSLLRVAILLLLFVPVMVLQWASGKTKATRALIPFPNLR
jgi:hypothetical protein